MNVALGIEEVELTEEMWDIYERGGGSVTPIFHDNKRENRKL